MESAAERGEEDSQDGDASRTDSLQIQQARWVRLWCDGKGNGLSLGGGG